MLVELKNGETLNGHLVNCDTYMNLTLKEVVQTSPEGDKFFRLPECYVRGNNVCSRCCCVGMDGWMDVLLMACDRSNICEYRTRSWT